jgi:hypothetical protein
MVVTTGNLIVFWCGMSLAHSSVQGPSYHVLFPISGDFRLLGTTMKLFPRRKPEPTGTIKCVTTQMSVWTPLGRRIYALW